MSRQHKWSDAPFFSILTASLNSCSTLASTLASVSSQTFNSLEHIVCDGCSSDGTLNLLTSFESRHPLRWLSERDDGIADALNKAVAQASGRYLLVLQADDVLIDPTVIDRVHRLMDGECYDVYSFPVLRCTKKSTWMYRAVRIPWWFHFKNTIPHQGAFVRKELYDRIGAYRVEFSIAMDYDFFYRAFLSGVRINFQSMPVALMGSEGVSSAPSFLRKRLNEEWKVQCLNEKNRAWRVAQFIFRRLYLPYKVRSWR
jgi:glycosyltransferase involved in cell wall biosynthesis